MVGFAAGSLLFIVANLVAAHLQSDCGLPAVLGLSSCADDIRRAGFPLVFWESGGFAFRNLFKPTAFIVDLAAGAGLSVACGLAAAFYMPERQR